MAIDASIILKIQLYPQKDFCSPSNRLLGCRDGLVLHELCLGYAGIDLFPLFSWFLMFTLKAGMLTMVGTYINLHISPS